MNHGNIVNRLNDSEKRIYDIGRTVQSRIPNQSAPDARVTTFFNLAQAIRFPKISFLLLDEYLSDKQSWVDTTFYFI